MRQTATGRTVDTVDTRLAARLAELRAERGWSLGELADRSGISRSTLSRAERAETSPTAALLNRLCHVYGRTMSRLLGEVESAPAPVVRAADQQVWQDRPSGFVRRSVSPPHAGLRAELVEGRLGAGADIAYDRPPVPGLEQHLWVLDGVLEVTVQESGHRLEAGDCLRTRVWGATRFRCPGPGEVRYLLAVVLP
ncbi:MULTISPECIES: helix-turn-helix domain-containing protein [unclassified Streptomyces]|uniref:helix-turn-helix domain-containing protein n=1 Tax=unclassified Streptomyces TaxID=2593676 RepID=UPI00074A235D|nr:MULTISPECIES: XRE family transcriptional regulator [unclassified Streptomyces]KUL74130.1 DNA-binding protein [Streptomyces sp. NRRL WC-3605]KUL74900.1 DNA-binding protein [Streptomyces sp. NRRL WC-3604]